MNQEFEEKAYAKINLRLKVTGRYEDGYHQLDMVNCTIDFYDCVSIQLLSEPEVHLTIQGEGAETLRHEAVESNLAVQAWQSFRDTFGWPLGIDLNINKQIPTGSGLGGGSADAAAVLRVLYREALKQKKIAQRDDNRLFALGASIGADIPFQLQGGIARVQGKGEVVRPLSAKLLRDRHCLLIIPPIHSSTPEVFASYAKQKENQFSSTDSAIQTINEELLENDLFDAACKCHPELSRLSRELEVVLSCKPAFSGSGSTFFILRDLDGFNSDVVSKIKRLADSEKCILKSASLLANFNGMCQI